MKLIEKLIDRFSILVFRLRNGFDYRDCWNLDHSLAKWLVPRLRFLSKNTASAPIGYPNLTIDIGGNWEAKTDFEAWSRDLGIAADQLEAWVERQEFYDGDFEKDKMMFDDSKKAMMWVAEWYHSLWD